ncbi:hypothetical protein DFH07DRAFT_693257, partial [Mycena maculata]
PGIRTGFTVTVGQLTPLVDFYSKLPKGPAPTRIGGLKTRYFSGKNASAAPVL